MFLAIHVPDCSAGAHAILLDCASAFSPRVENTASHTVVLDIEGLERMFGSYSEIADHLLRHVAEAGIHPTIAIASNPDAAVIAARGNSGITIIDAGKEAASLKDLHIDLLQVDEETHGTLRRWGIYTFGALARLPVKQIAERLGQAGVQLHKLARGSASRPLVPQTPPLRFEEGLDLDDSIGLLEPLTFILTRLLDALFTRLRRRGLSTAELHLHLQRERPHELFTRVFRLPFPVQKPRIVMKLMMLDLEARLPGARVIGVKVEAIPVKPRVVQNGLFVPLSPEPEKLELTLARISAVVGKENVGKAEIADSHARDRFRLSRFGNFEIRISKFEMMDSHAAIRLLRPALEATVQIREGIPIWIGFSGLHGRIETASGPWNGSGDWWDQKQWDREEWDIGVSGTLLRIYKNLLTGRWYAEGVYD